MIPQTLRILADFGRACGSGPAHPREALPEDGCFTIVATWKKNDSGVGLTNSEMRPWEQLPVAGALTHTFGSLLEMVSPSGPTIIAGSARVASKRTGTLSRTLLARKSEVSQGKHQTSFCRSLYACFFERLKCQLDKRKGKCSSFSRTRFSRNAHVSTS